MNSSQMSNYLKSEVCDIVVAEFRGEGKEGIKPQEIILQIEKDVPLILLTGAILPESQAALLSQGVTDCIEMNRINHFPVVVSRAMGEKQLRAECERAEKQLRQSEAHYRALVGNLAYGICRCNAKGKFLDVNHAMVEMLGYRSREELLNIDLAGEIICDPFRRLQLLGLSAGNDPANRMEIDWKRNDGTNLRVRVSGREVLNEKGSLSGYEIIAEDVTKQREVIDRLRRQAAEDPLTGIANYRRLVEVLDGEIKRSKRTGREFSLLFFDLDGLKQINDQFGHLIGNQAICRLANTLSLSCRDIDTPARLGGDEFAVVLPETSAESANLVALRICDGLVNDGGQPKLSASVGIATYPTDSEKIETLLIAADAAMYSMKTKGHSRAAES